MDYPHLIHGLDWPRPKSPVKSFKGTIMESVAHLSGGDEGVEQEGSRPTLSAIPTSSLIEFYLPLLAFDVSERSKSGCAGCCSKSR